MELGLSSSQNGPFSLSECPFSAVSKAVLVVKVMDLLVLEPLVLATGWPQAVNLEGTYLEFVIEHSIVWVGAAI